MKFYGQRSLNGLSVDDVVIENILEAGHFSVYSPRDVSRRLLAIGCRDAARAIATLSPIGKATSGDDHFQKMEVFPPASHRGSCIEH